MLFNSKIIIIFFNRPAWLDRRQQKEQHLVETVSNTLVFDHFGRSWSHTDHKHVQGQLGPADWPNLARVEQEIAQHSPRATALLRPIRANRLRELQGHWPIVLYTRARLAQECWRKRFSYYRGRANFFVVGQLFKRQVHQQHWLQIKTIRLVLWQQIAGAGLHWFPANVSNHYNATNFGGN